jgi:hypothetical protein
MSQLFQRLFITGDPRITETIVVILSNLKKHVRFVTLRDGTDFFMSKRLLTR